MQIIRTFLTVLLLSVPPLLAEDAPFGLVPPSAISQLAAKKGTPEGLAIIETAADHLTATPHALERIHMEGTLPHQGIWDQSILAVADFDIMRNLALAYRLTGDSRYLKATETYLVAWSTTYKVSLNPIDETHLDNLVIAYDLVKADAATDTRQKTENFLHQLAVAYAAGTEKQKKDAGNWQSHRLKLFTLASYAIGDQKLIDEAHALFSDHVKQNIRSDGSVYDFYRRDALHYVTYDLEPLTIACLAAKEHGQDWFTEAAPGTVQSGINWLLPFATGQKTHIEFVHSTVAFDKKRADAGVGEYAPHPWAPSASATLLTAAASVDPSYKTTCSQVCIATQKKRTDWLVLLYW